MCCCVVSVKEYIESANGLKQRIYLIDKLIDQMILSLLEAQEGKDPTIREYQMNDGQMVVRTEYKSNTDLEQGIKSLERIKQMYINRLNGNVFLLRNSKGRR